MIVLRISLGILMVATMLTFAACGGGTPKKEDVTASIKKIMPVNFEVLQISPVKEIPGLNEVVVKVDKQPVVLYVDSKVKYVVSGSIVAIDSKQNLTSETQKKFVGK